MSITFGEFIKQSRLDARFGLREFARIIGMQPSNYCNLENDHITPKVGVLEKMAQTLGLTKGSDKYIEFHDLAAKRRHDVPEDIKRIVNERDLIPAMLRTVEDENVTEEQILGIIDYIKSGEYLNSENA